METFEARRSARCDPRDEGRPDIACTGVSGKKVRAHVNKWAAAGQWCGHVRTARTRAHLRRTRGPRAEPCGFSGPRRDNKNKTHKAHARRRGPKTRAGTTSAPLGQPSLQGRLRAVQVLGLLLGGAILERKYSCLFIAVGDCCRLLLRRPIHAPFMSGQSDATKGDSMRRALHMNCHCKQTNKQTKKMSRDEIKRGQRRRLLRSTGGKGGPLSLVAGR